eukprot:8183713-Alexandrium_andersonii.AAC.1
MAWSTPAVSMQMECIMALAADERVGVSKLHLHVLGAYSVDESGSLGRKVRGGYDVVVASLGRRD